MKVIYTGKTKDFTPQLEKKVEAKLAKLGKLIEQRGEKEAHVCHRQERHLHKVDIKSGSTTMPCSAPVRIRTWSHRLRRPWRSLKSRW